MYRMLCHFDCIHDKLDHCGVEPTPVVLFAVHIPERDQWTERSRWKDAHFHGWIKTHRQVWRGVFSGWVGFSSW